MKNPKRGSSETGNLRFTFVLPPSKLEAVRRIADVEKRSVGWVMRQAIDDYIERHPPPPDQLSLLSKDPS